MKHHLNTLFVTTQGAAVRKQGQAVEVRIEKKTALRLPMHQLDGIACFGRVWVSPYLMGAAAEVGLAISIFTEHGRFLAAVQGFSPGNVLLRREQYRRADDLDASLKIARPIVAAKTANLRTVLLRGARDRTDESSQKTLRDAATRLASDAESAMGATSLDQLRGIEGDSAATYFASFPALITADHEAFRFTQRSRRPPMDPVNALLSFFYTLLAHDYRSAAEAAGLDAAVGFFHRDRPGRPSLALDLMEALRPVLADRLALSLINRGQLKPADFQKQESGAVLLTDQARKTVLTAYQKRKQDPLEHPFLGEKVELGLVPHLQARLLARHLRGDHDFYPEFIWR